MPIVDVQVIKGVFDDQEKREIITRVTETMVELEGENMRDVTWVRIREVNEGEWAIGGQPLTAEMVRAKRGAPPKPAEQLAS